MDLKTLSAKLEAIWPEEERKEIVGPLLYDPPLHDDPRYRTFIFDPGKSLTMYFERVAVISA